jgi:hypothetical protein
MPTPTPTTTAPATPASTTPTTPENEALRTPGFDEQAFLMFNINKLAPTHKNVHRQVNGDYSKIDLLKGKNSTLINKLLAADFFKKEAVLNLSPAQISELVPQVRIYKQNLNAALDVTSEVEFRFPTYVESLQDVGRNSYGLTSFDIESQGTTFYTADKQFTAKMSLYFQTFDDFVKSRDGYKFVDLILQSEPPGGSPESISAPPTSGGATRPPLTSNLSAFRIRVEVGWSIGSITANSAFSSRYSREMINAINRTKISFFLYLTHHSLNINDDGTLNVDIEYIGAFDLASRDVRAGIILTKEQKAELDLLSNNLKIAVAANSEVDIKDQKNALFEKKGEFAKTGFESIMKEMLEGKPSIQDSSLRTSMVYQTAISRTIIDQFALAAGKTPSEAPNTSPPATPAAGITAAQQKAAIDICTLQWEAETRTEDGIVYPLFKPLVGPNESPVDTETMVSNPILIDEVGNEFYNLSWFYLGDLMEVLMNRAFDETMADDEKLIRSFGGSFSKRVKMILSDIEMIEFCSGEQVRINLAHIPVSVRKFTTFFYSKIITSRNLDYTIDDFVRDFLNDLANDIFLNRSYISNRSMKQTVKLRYMNLAVYSKTPKVDPLRNGNSDLVPVNSVNAGKFLKSNSIDSNPNAYHFYLIIYQDTFDPNQLKGDYTTDRNMGIPHIYTGRDRGIVKKASFKRTAIPYQREERIAAEGRAFDPVLQLASLYNVDLETYGNTLFLAGTYFYLIPTGMGSGLGLPNNPRSYANIMGLGGYYFVHKVTWSLASGKYITNIASIHQATGAPNSVANNDLIVRGGQSVASTDE